MRKYIYSIISLLMFFCSQPLWAGDACRVMNTLATSDDGTVEVPGDEIGILQTIYKNYVFFGSKDFSEIAEKVCTPELCRSLKEDYLDNYECIDGDCYASWKFRTCSQDGPSDVSEVKKIVEKGDGWFDVYYSDLGIDGLTSIHFVKVNGKPMIDKIKLDKSYYEW
ncbi:hypothetical protein [uncultured Bacteroides sp.]|uniref:hypothetical protein n=1 Tax=uncultured Bacteroides sp. TaxID=162156 RepID=UPI002606FA68|nr:hypothetical protein [uncultured Bacteroides sp.]